MTTQIPPAQTPPAQTPPAQTPPAQAPPATAPEAPPLPTETPTPPPSPTSPTISMLIEQFVASRANLGAASEALHFEETRLEEATAALEPRRTAVNAAINQAGEAQAAMVAAASALQEGLERFKTAINVQI